MPSSSYNFIWRCAKCSNHFANITKMDGVLKQEKKCPKCKSINIITLANKEIFIHCKLYDQNTNDYRNEFENNYPYPE
ncbi:hypothetical protein KAJ61_03760 [Candidatus Parcubacteria bacterium]|nr:hypothetical protein [Candidatus Parcubacteria bacterium]